jgi:hypothetical protein
MTKDRAKWLCTNKIAGELWKILVCSLTGDAHAQHNWRVAEELFEKYQSSLTYALTNNWHDGMTPTEYEHCYGQEIWRAIIVPAIKVDQIHLHAPYQGVKMDVVV